MEGSPLGRALSVGLLLLEEESPVGEFGSEFPGGIGGNNCGASVLGSSTLGITVAGPYGVDIGLLAVATSCWDRVGAAGTIAVSLVSFIGGSQIP